jgi:hypothetical protein
MLEGFVLRVLYVSDYLTPEQRAAFGRRPHQGFVDRRLTIGEEYLALGLTYWGSARDARSVSFLYL